MATPPGGLVLLVVLSTFLFGTISVFDALFASLSFDVKRVDGKDDAVVADLFTDVGVDFDVGGPLQSVHFGFFGTFKKTLLNFLAPLTLVPLPIKTTLSQWLLQ